jgi:hypothetical protein
MLRTQTAVRTLQESRETERVIFLDTLSSFISSLQPLLCPLRNFRVGWRDRFGFQVRNDR